MTLYRILDTSTNDTAEYLVVFNPVTNRRTFFEEVNYLVKNANSSYKIKLQLSATIKDILLPYHTILSEHEIEGQNIYKEIMETLPELFI